MRALIATLILVGCFLVPAGAQQPAAPASPANRLLSAKLIYVAPMPDHLDQWLIQDLRAWGKYQVSGNPQGVDLEIRAERTHPRTHFAMRDGTIQRTRPKAPSVLAISVVDWVTGARLWQGKILNASPKKNQSPPSGPETEIHARHMTPDQIAQRCVTDLRLYVTQLQQHPASK